MSFGYETQDKLDALMEELNIEDPGSALQQAVCEFMGVKDIPVDQAFDYLVDQLAESIGGKGKGNADLAYVVTKIAILATAEAVGIGSGVLSLDTTGFSLARIRAAVEDIQKKVNMLVDKPKRLAIDSYWDVLNMLQTKQIPEMIGEVRQMIAHAKSAFDTATRSADPPNMENLKDAVHMKILEMIARLLQSSFDEQNGVIKPFCLLSPDKKTYISNIMEKAIKDLKVFKTKVPTKKLGFQNKALQAERQDVMDGAYKVAYPFISEAKGKTNPLTKLTSPSFEFQVMVQNLPEGASDKTRVTIGQESGKQRAVWLWLDKDADGGRVLVATWEGAVTGVSYTKDEEEVSVKINFPSAGNTHIVYVSYHDMLFFYVVLQV